MPLPSIGPAAARGTPGGRAIIGRGPAVPRKWQWRTGQGRYRTPLFRRRSGRAGGRDPTTLSPAPSSGFALLNPACESPEGGRRRQAGPTDLLRSRNGAASVQHFSW